MTQRTALEMKASIARIVDECRIAAGRSEYHWKVSVMAVGAAAACFERTAVSGTPGAYREAVVAALEALRENYDDPDGEYTSGKSDIGTVIRRIRQLEP